MRAARDLGTFAEIACAAESVESYEREVIALVEKRVGFDVAFFKRPSGLGGFMRGVDRTMRDRLDRRWTVYADETRPCVEVAMKQRGVVVDTEVFGRRIERLAYYQEIMRPVSGRNTALLYAMRRGAPVAGLAVGRCSVAFRDADLEYLRAIGPTIAVCEVTVQAQASAGRSLRDFSTATSLTAREREVLGYLHLGYTNEQIACALGTAARTVRNQLSRAYAKLGVASRAEAVDAVLALGLVRR